jgi:hypothetical protein
MKLQQNRSDAAWWPKFTNAAMKSIARDDSEKVNKTADCVPCGMKFELDVV